MSDRPALYRLPGLLCDAIVRGPQVEALSAAYDIRIPDFRSFDDLTAIAQAVLAEAPARFAMAGHSTSTRERLKAGELGPNIYAMREVMAARGLACRAYEAD